MTISADTLPIWLAIPVIVLLFLGGAVILIGALGLYRLSDFYRRIHGPAITITLGTGCILIASMLYFSGLQSRPVIHELLITVFVIASAPVVSMLIMRAAVYRDLRAGRIDYTSENAHIHPFPLESDTRPGKSKE